MKYVFTVGGVCSGLGKGIVASSIGMLLKNAGYKVFSIKLDQYLNIDPGTMNPFEHGEVFVTDDGLETDLDLGHYERFMDVPLSKYSLLTTGQLYERVLKKERKGQFLGKTVQVIPHVINEIKDYIKKAGKQSEADVMMIEIGGTIGDLEGSHFYEAVRQIKLENKPEDVVLVLVALLPYLKVTNELKSKPAQMAVRELLRIGLNPDILVPRSDYKIPEEVMNKLALFGNVEKEAVVPNITTKYLYELPLKMQKDGLLKQVSKLLKLDCGKLNTDSWKQMISNMKNSKEVVKIGIAGKYNALDDAYLSVLESLKFAGWSCQKTVEIIWVDTEKLEIKDDEEFNKLKEIDGLVIPGGFGTRGVEGKIKACKYAREHDLPFLGLCLGSQIMAIEFARNVLGLKNATSEEFNPNNEHLIVHIMEDQKNVKSKGGTMRLGAYNCVLKEGSLAHKLYNQQTISERHRHRFEFNNEYRDQFEDQGLIISGTSPDGNLVEIVENSNHPFMIASQFHPEFKSRPNRPHPLFKGLIESIIKK